jgi:hypothetical protein
VVLVSIGSRSKLGEAKRTTIGDGNGPKGKIRLG